MGLVKYIKAAFLNRWNVLAFLGGLGFAFLSGRPDVVAPIVLAAEIGYLGLLGTHPRFQKYVDAAEVRMARRQESRSADETLEQIMRSLPADSLRQFEALRARCRDLREIALDLRRPGRTVDGMPLEEIQVAGLDRLLWIYLRLLFTQHALNRFFEKTNEERIKRDIERLEGRLEKVAKSSQSSQRERLLKTLEDNLQTSRHRLENYQKAKDNFELIHFELERIENKIRSLSELAVNRQEPDFITGQVDQVAESMLETERTMNELQFVTGLDRADEQIPELVQRQTVSIGH